MKGLGKRLSTARKAAGYTVTEAAELLNVCVSTITYWEKERHEPGLDTLHAIADLYGTTVSSLIRPLAPHSEPALATIHEAARLLSNEINTDKVLELVDRIKLGASAMLKEKRRRCLAEEDDD